MRFRRRHLKQVASTGLVDRHVERLNSLAYELSLRALDQQERVLGELRSRTGLVFAGSSIAASFLGARAVANHGLGWLSSIALAAFAVSLAPTIYILLPKGTFVFALRGTTLIEDPQTNSLEISELHRRLAYWLEGFYVDNQPAIARLYRLYQLAVAAVVLEVILWGVQIVLA